MNQLELLAACMTAYNIFPVMKKKTPRKGRIKIILAGFKKYSSKNRESRAFSVLASSIRSTCPRSGESAYFRTDDAYLLQSGNGVVVKLEVRKERSSHRWRE